MNSYVNRKSYCFSSPSSFDNFIKFRHEIKRQEKLESIESKICMDLYRIFIDAEDRQAISMDQGTSTSWSSGLNTWNVESSKSLLFSLEKLMISSSKNEKDLEKLVNTRNELKKELVKQTKLVEKQKVDDKKYMAKIKQTNWIINMQVIAILCLVSLIAIVVFKK